VHRDTARRSPKPAESAGIKAVGGTAADAGGTNTRVNVDAPEPDRVKVWIRNAQ
jgi:hypothetical protein